MGFVALPGIPASHRIVELGVAALARLAHRGGLDADGRSGDGAGLLIQVPRRLLGEVAVAALFEWDPRARALFQEALAGCGLRLREWRRVPVDPAALGERALETQPALWHGLIDPLDLDAEEWENALYRARRLAERRAEAEGVRLYVASCSHRTLVYKGLLAGTYLGDFYLDLRDPRCESQVAVFHQRYSTNTLPDWRNAQPFRLLAHNGEINTLTGNRAWMRAREAGLPAELRGVVWAEGSDSASLDNVLELLRRRGFGLGEALMALVPQAWEGRGDLSPSVRDFYRYQSTRFEPWDGPAALSFSDGRWAGAALDRNGLRPLRYQVARDGLVVAASEAGVVPLPPAEVTERGRLGPGQLLLVDLGAGELLRDAEAKARVAGQHDYGLLADRLLVPVERHHLEVEPAPELDRHLVMHGWGQEDLKLVLAPMAETGAEPVWSMGDDIPIAPLGRTPRRLYGYLRQRFAQVTNPAIDPLRERFVMSLRTLLGARTPALEPEGGAERELARRHHPATPDHPAALLELDSPVLGDHELGRVLERALVLDATFAPDETLRGALEHLRQEARAAPAGILALSDREAGPGRLPIPMALAVGAVHEALLSAGRRLEVDVVAITGDACDVHDLACLVTLGASAVHPYLALGAAGAQGANVRKALELGLLKVMAKMGISCVQSYCGGAVLEALGLGAEVMELCFPSVPSRIGGADLTELEALLRRRHTDAWGDVAALTDFGRVRFRRAGHDR